ncbi:MAG: DUF3667 domain-containing protein [Bdellovibrionaceae bacterium]|nr:DUF3667 domain-containing protein [Pseudobdellovibrionaceae bacterium]
MQCANCGYKNDGKYCSQCGQKMELHLNPTLHDLIHDGVHEFLHIDGKIFNTIYVLLRYPGKLTKEFLQGRRVPYINPIRLYLSLSILYFLLSSLVGVHTEIKVQNTDKIDINIYEHIEDPYYREKIKKLEPIFKEGLRKIEKNGNGEFKNLYAHSLAKALFLLLPVFAWLLKMTYFRRKQRYPQYLYFSLHYHAALFAGLILTIPLSYLMDTLLFWLIWAVGYLTIALKSVWGDSTKRAIQRTLVTLFIYSLIFAVVSGLIAFYTLYHLGAY